MSLLNHSLTRVVESRLFFPLMDALLALPRSSNSISPHSLGFLNEHLKSQKDLSRAQPLSTELKKECGDLDRNLIILRNNLSSLISSWISRSNSIRRLLHHLNFKIQRFGNGGGLYTSQDGMEEKMNLRKIPKILDQDLPMLAKEVRRIEMVRSYAETTLRLEAMVGDLEDAVSCVMNQNTSTIFSVNLLQTSSSTDIRWKLEKLLLAVKTMNAIEEVLVSIAKTRPQWYRLLKSVDARLDKPMALLRLQALADHRTLIASIGWPPPLLTSELEREKGTALTNPLVLMQGETREGYSQSFLALCALQHLQTRRGGRLLNIPGHQRNHELDLWAIDELVSPIASRFEYHFLKWSDEPKFIFALVYKITKDYIGGIDDVLQPLIDKAMLMGCSAKEAWVSAMSRTLSAYLTKGMFSVLSERYRKKNEKAEAIFSWLHLVDLIISFDKRMQSLANLGTPLSLGQPVQFEQISRGMSILSIFCDRPDWFKLWAKIEHKDALMKLKTELENERAWMVNDKRESESCTQGKAEPFLLSTTEDYKAPCIAESVVNITRAVIERCQTLPSIKLQAQFIRLSAAKVLWHFFSILLNRCEETGHAEDDSLMRISGSINAARYCESILQEWSEDVNFLEMRIAEDDLNTQVRSDLADRSCFFWEEIKCLMKMETDWVAELMADLLRQFDTLSWEYVQNKEQWLNEQMDLTPKNGLGSGDLTLSTGLVEALDALRIRLQVLKDDLNSKDFLDLWRSVADGVDQFIFGSIVMSDARFSDHGVAQFITDMGALFLVFRPFCARPEAFLPRIRDSLKLLEMVSKDDRQLQSVLSTGGKKIECLRVRGIVHFSSNQAEKIIKNRYFVV